MAKVLFIYPNQQPRQLPIQIGIASLSAVLKKFGHKTSLFDTTFYNTQKELSKIIKDLRLKIKKFEPDVIAISCRSLEFKFIYSILKILGEEIREKNIKIIVGGPHATVKPGEVIKSDVNAICLGEGEYPLLEFVNNLEKKKSIKKIKNLWVKEKNKIYKNPVRPLIQNLDELPYPDWSIFDERHLIYPHPIKKMSETRVGSFEFSGGCPFSCTYCINKFMQNLYKGKGKYHREKTIKRCINELLYFKEKYNLEAVYIIDEVFLLNEKRLEKFCEIYKKKIDLPFTIMARPETVTEKKLQMVKKAGCFSIDIGIEEGNEKFRRKILNRHMTNEQIIKAFYLAKKTGLYTSSFNMVGLPYETRKLVFETIELNRKAKPHSIQATIFYPFDGTKLKEICEEKNFIKNDKNITSYYTSGVIDMPQFSRDEIEGLARTFYFYCKAPKKIWPLINFLEKNNKLSKLSCRIINVLIRYKLKIFPEILNRIIKK